MNDQTYTIEYERVPEEARVLTSYLFTLYEKLGIPSTITAEELTPACWKFIDQIFLAWKVGFPQEYEEWIGEVKNELEHERTIQDAIKSGGYTPIAYPVRIYNLLKVFFPLVKINDKNFIKYVTKIIPDLKHTKYKL